MFSRRSRPQAAIAAVVVVGALSVLPSAPAWATGSGSDWVTAGTGNQYAEWHAGTQKLKMLVITNSMSSNRCQDAMLDWLSASGQHYDSRVLRDCKPSSTNTLYDWSTNQVSSQAGLDTSDPWWHEPDSAWTSANISDMQKGYGYEMSDTYSNGTFAHYEAVHFSGSGTGSMANYWEHVPRTCSDHYARVLTLYNDGHYTGCKNYPADSAS